MQPNTANAYPTPFKRQVPINSNTLLSTLQLNGLIVVDSSLAPVIITLPFANTIRASGFFQILALNGATNPVTVLFQGGDTYNNGQIAALTLDQNAQNLLVAATEDATRWLVLLSVAGGGVGGNTLNQAYDQGGPGVGRTINADAGPVQISGPDGVRSAGTIVAGAVTAPVGAEVLRAAGQSRFEEDIVVANNGDIIPTGDNQGNIGLPGARWGTVRANDIVAGDLHLKAPDGSADWTLQEEPDRLVAINNKTRKRYELALKELQEE